MTKITPAGIPGPAQMANSPQSVAAPTPMEISAAYNRVTAGLSSLGALAAITKIPLVIVESPYKGLSNAEEYCMACCWDCMTRGEAPFASHLIYTRFLDDKDPEQRSLGMLFGRAWLRAADHVAVYNDHGVSSGMDMAISVALSLKKRIEYRRLFLD